MSYQFREENVVRLSSGTELRVDRPRSLGPLSAAELAHCRDMNIPLAYDPMQSGWVSAATLDDITGADVIVEAERASVILRPWRMSDLTRFRALLDDPAVWTMLPETYPDPLTDDLARTLLDVSINGQHHMVRAIEQQGEVVGQVRLAFGVLPTEPKLAELSYWLGRDHWGQGLARTAIESLLKQSAPRPLSARVLPDNLASRRILEKLGFIMMGRDSRDPNWFAYRRG